MCVYGSVFAGIMDIAVNTLVVMVTVILVQCRSTLGQELLPDHHAHGDGKIVILK